MSEVKQIEKIAERYRQNGYQVSLHPGRAEVPSFLGSFQPDIIAHKAGESVVVEVKYRRELASDSELSFVAHALEANPPWRLDLVVEGEEPPWPDRVAEADEPGARDIASLLESSRRLMSSGELSAACLTAGAAIEASLRAIASQHALHLEQNEPGFVLGALYSAGIISRDEFTSIGALIRIRNTVAHGLKPRSLDEASIRAMLDAASRLARAAFRPAA